MDLHEARIDAENLLNRVLENQPHLISGAPGHNHLHGDAVAKFCSQFIDAYADYLVKRPSSGR